MAEHRATRDDWLRRAAWLLLASLITGVAHAITDWAWLAGMRSALQILSVIALLIQIYKR